MLGTTEDSTPAPSAGVAITPVGLTLDPNRETVASGSHNRWAITRPPKGSPARGNPKRNNVKPHAMPGAPAGSAGWSGPGAARLTKASDNPIAMVGMRTRSPCSHGPTSSLPNPRDVKPTALPGAATGIPCSSGPGSSLSNPRFGSSVSLALTLSAGARETNQNDRDTTEPCLGGRFSLGA